MKTSIYSLYDRVSQRHLPLWLAENDATAQRALAGALTQDQKLSQHHADYDVINLGTLDQVTGVITPGHTHVCTLTSCMKSNAVPFVEGRRD